MLGKHSTIELTPAPRYYFLQENDLANALADQIGGGVYFLFADLL